MVILAAQPSLKTLGNFVAKVHSFPISARQLLDFAANIRAPKEIITFYKSFSPDRIFDDKEDLSSSSEQVDVMRKEGSDMPKEEERSPEEY
jgi:hypothetical protein